MLQLKNITKTFNHGPINEKHALHGLDLPWEDGACLTLSGLP